MKKVWETVPVVLALLLAATAAAMSSGNEVRQEVTEYLGEALAPQMADLPPPVTDIMGTPLP